MKKCSNREQNFKVYFNQLFFKPASNMYNNCNLRRIRIEVPVDPFIEEKN